VTNPEANASPTVQSESADYENRAAETSRLERNGASDHQTALPATKAFLPKP
jgi:hypothetical protein